MRFLSKCTWCHTMVERPCETILECRTCSEPYTLTAEQTNLCDEIISRRTPLLAKPLPLEDDEERT